jgi:hypothetical protein
MSSRNTRVVEIGPTSIPNSAICWRMARPNESVTAAAIGAAALGRQSRPERGGVRGGGGGRGFARRRPDVDAVDHAAILLIPRTRKTPATPDRPPDATPHNPSHGPARPQKSAVGGGLRLLSGL